MQQIKLQSCSILIRGIQMNQLIGNDEEESGVATSAEDLEVEEDDG
jgi:hypothetical protein